MAPTPLLLLLSIDIKHLSSVPSFMLFPLDCGMNWLINKAFDLDYYTLASNCAGIEVDLSFEGCQYF